MENQTKLKMMRRTAQESIFPHKIVRLDQISQLEEDVFSVDGLDIKMTPRATKKLNTLIGTTNRQLRTVRNFSGGMGQSNFRNYLSVAISANEEKNIVILADPNSQVISNVIVPKVDFIPVDMFFDFAELFIEETHSVIEKMQHSLNGDMDIILYFKHQYPMIKSIADGEDFETNGFFLHWNGAKVEVGNYYTRLVCTNGQIEECRTAQSKIFSLQPESISSLLNFAKSDSLFKIGFSHFEQKVKRAITTKASLNELHFVSDNLAGHSIGLPSQLVESLSGYEANKGMFERLGADVRSYSSLMKTDSTIWTIYNKLTAFATHTELLEKSDIKRKAINNVAIKLLQKDYDIKNYIEYV